MPPEVDHAEHVLVLVVQAAGHPVSQVPNVEAHVVDCVHGLVGPLPWVVVVVAGPAVLVHRPGLYGLPS